MDPLKEAFTRVKEDITVLKDSLLDITSSLSLIKDNYDKKFSSLELSIFSLQASIESIKRQTSSQETPLYYPKNQPFHVPENHQTDTPSFKSDATLQTGSSNLSVGLSEEKHTLEPPYTQKDTFSNRNGGVPADRQTNRQTDKRTEIPLETPSREDSRVSHESSEFDRANKVMHELDTLKGEIALTIKGLTAQEMLVFSTVYTLEENASEPVDYALIARTIGLTESSIRDYVTKLIRKGIPIEKEKVHNKKIVLKIAESLKNVASLATILKIRDL